MEESKIRLRVEQGTAAVMNRVVIETGTCVPVEFKTKGPEGAPLGFVWYNPRSGTSGLKSIVVVTSAIENEKDLEELIKMINEQVEKYIHEYRTLGLWGGSTNEQNPNN